ncbi:hypothetical protein BGW37DRAFT_482219, partial [Umbelopsis sp. PMI_123]
MVKVRYYPVIDEGSPVRRIIFRALLGLFFIGILALIVVPTYVSFKRSNSQRQDSDISDTLTNNEISDLNNNGFLNESAILVNAQVSLVDPINNIIKLSFSYQASGDVASNSTQPSTAVPISIINDIETKSYPAGSRLPNSDYNVPLFGDVSNYPFETYTGAFGFTIVQGSPTNYTAIHTPVIVSSNLAQFRINGSVQSYPQPDSSEVYYLEFTIKRATTTIAFSVIIVILLWAMTIAACSITLQIILRGRALDLPILALNATLLFAMPALRNSQPSVPPIGIALDVLGFFFNMSLVALSFVTVISMHLMRYQVPKPTVTEVHNKA